MHSAHALHTHYRSRRRPCSWFRAMRPRAIRFSRLHERAPHPALYVTHFTARSANTRRTTNFQFFDEYVFSTNAYVCRYSKLGRLFKKKNRMRALRTNARAPRTRFNAYALSLYNTLALYKTRLTPHTRALHEGARRSMNARRSMSVRRSSKPLFTTRTRAAPRMRSPHQRALHARVRAAPR